MQIFKNLVKVPWWNVCMQMSFTVGREPGRAGALELLL